MELQGVLHAKYSRDEVDAFDFSQILYEQAQDLTEREDDLWKDLGEGDVTVQQDDEEETEEKYTQEIPIITANPTTPCVIIDNDHGEIRCCNKTSAELVGVWESTKTWLIALTKSFNFLVCA